MMHIGCAFLNTDISLIVIDVHMRLDHVMLTLRPVIRESLSDSGGQIR